MTEIVEIKQNDLVNGVQEGSGRADDNRMMTVFMEERTGDIEDWNYQSLMGLTQMNGYERRRNIFLFTECRKKKKLRRQC